MERSIHKKALLSTLVMWLLGGGIMGLSYEYDIGTLEAMGPGFIPYYCGVLLLLLGAIYLLASYFIPTEADIPKVHFSKDRLRGWLFIFLGMAAFVFLGEHMGFIPATFALVFVSSLGSTQFKLLSALLLSLGVTLIGAFVFIYLLDLQVPLFQLSF